MKQAIITSLLILLSATILAQGKLIRVDSESTGLRKDVPSIAFFEQEKTRLLMPQAAAFGVECVPSFSPEWALTYDSIAHTLVYKIAEKSIWHSTYGAFHKMKKGKKSTISVLRKRPKGYVAPDVQTYSLAVTPQQVQKIKAIWTTAVGTAEDREVFILDGTKWEYFIDGHRAKSHSNKNQLVKFTNALAETVRTGNVSRKDSLFAASQEFFISMPAAPKP